MAEIDEEILKCNRTEAIPGYIEENLFWESGTWRKET